MYTYWYTIHDRKSNRILYDGMTVQFWDLHSAMSLLYHHASNLAGYVVIRVSGRLYKSGVLVASTRGM